jgi:homoserine kinase
VLIITEESESSTLPAIIRQTAGDQSIEVLQTKISTGVLETRG